MESGDVLEVRHSRANGVSTLKSGGGYEEKQQEITRPEAFLDLLRLYRYGGAASYELYT